MIRLKAIKPTNPFDVAAYRRARETALDTTAKWTKAEFEKTTATWKHKPAFAIDSPSDSERVIGTDDANYERMDEGTRPHVIVARGKVLAFPSGHQAKTRPRVIGSTGGGRSGVMVFTPRVNHPGTEAREFSEVIGEQAETELAKQMQREINGVR